MEKKLKEPMNIKFWKNQQIGCLMWLRH